MRKNIFPLNRSIQVHSNLNCWVKARAKKSIKWIVMLALVVFFVAPSTSLGQGGEDPDCENDRSIKGCISEIITEQSAMIDEVEGLLNDIATMGMFSLGQGQFGLANQMIAIQSDLQERITTLRNGNMRSGEANDASTDLEYEETVDKSDQKKGRGAVGRGSCKDSDLDFVLSLIDEDILSFPPGFSSVDFGFGKNKLGNDKCDIFAAVDLDGNNVTVNERAENMCALRCEFKKNNEGNPRKGESKKRLVDSLLDAKFTAGVARQNLSLQRAQMAVMKPQIAKLQLSALDPSASVAEVCESGFDVPALLEIISTGVSIVNSAVAFTTAALETAKDNVKPAANQTVAGFNAGSTVIPFALVAGISKMTGEVVGGIEKVLTIAAKIVAAFQDQTLLNCIASVQGEFEGPDGAIIKLQEAISQLQVDAGQTNTELGLIKADVALIKSLVEENNQLLLTPHGIRED